MAQHSSGFSYFVSPKPSLSPKQQVQLLQRRGLQIHDPAKAEQLLTFVNYFTRRDIHQRSLDSLKDNFQRSKEQFAEHYRLNYPNLTTPPIWVSVELLSFGDISFWFRNTKSQGVKRRVSSSFGGFEPGFFEDYVKQASTVRNMCSHHSRLGNRVLPTRQDGSGRANLTVLS